MQTIGISALQDIRKFKGFENAVIAGGFVRDSILGGEPTDIDIFVPVRDSKEFIRILDEALGIEPKTNIEKKKEAYKYLYNNGIVSTSSSSSTTGLSSYVTDFVSSLGQKIDLTSLKDGGYLRPKIDKLGPFSDLVLRKNVIGKNPYKDGSKMGRMQGYLYHYDGKYMGAIDCDIIAIQFDGDAEKFNLELLKQFHYGIDQALWNGEESLISTFFEKDMKFNEATLLELSDLNYLPKAMEKFNKLKAKYPHISWRTTALEIKKGEPDKRKSKLKPVPEVNNHVNW